MNILAPTDAQLLLVKRISYFVLGYGNLLYDKIIFPFISKNLNS
jgi:hypothetical protein